MTEAAIIYGNGLRYKRVKLKVYLTFEDLIFADISPFTVGSGSRGFWRKKYFPREKISASELKIFAGISFRECHQIKYFSSKLSRSCQKIAKLPNLFRESFFTLKVITNQILPKYFKK